MEMASSEFTPEVTHPHYMFPDGEMVSKRTVDAALRIVNKMAQGCVVVELDDEDLFSKGDKVDAIWRFRQKHNASIAEAKAAIEHLRGESS
jgi:hypothetical protein